MCCCDCCFGWVLGWVLFNCCNGFCYDLNCKFSRFCYVEMWMLWWDVGIGYEDVLEGFCVFGFIVVVDMVGWWWNFLEWRWRLVFVLEGSCVFEVWRLGVEDLGFSDK